jgi:hypothetical protein
MVAVSSDSFSYRALVAQLLTAPISRGLGSDFWSHFLAWIDKFFDHGQSSPRWMGSWIWVSFAMVLIYCDGG